MVDIDEDRLELLERQLAERVTARVQPALFRLYALVGTVVVAILGFVSWDVVGDIKREIKAEVTDAIEEDIGEKRREIAERVSQTRFLAGRANEVIARVERQLDAFEPQAENLNATIEQVRNLNVTSQDLIATYAAEVEPLVAGVEALSEQLRTLAEEVDSLRRAAADAAAQAGASAGDANGAAGADEGASSAPSASAYETSGEVLQSVIAGTRANEARLEQARARTTVFVQFAGGTSERADALGAALASAGYTVPGEERLKQAVGKHEVRYFHDEDEAAARALAAEVNRALDALGTPLPEAVRATSLTGYAAKKPRPGVLELWIELPAV